MTAKMAALLLLALALGALGQTRGPQGVFQTDVPKHPVDVVLARPTATSVTLSVLCYADAKAYVAYGTGKDDLSLRTEVQDLKRGVPQEMALATLKADTGYCYELHDATGKALTAGTFHTQRRPGSGFVFAVQADSHLDENASPDLYRRTLANEQADAPDFLIDLGDTFMTGKHASRETAAKQYLAQRYYFGLVGRSAPVFLVLGNHDGEESNLLRGGADSLAVWANAMRKRYFPNPVPDGFYSGNETKHPLAGTLQDYYAWAWGDALFIVLDPYWYSSAHHNDDGWDLSLGADQYHWLGKTLESSKARLKFVFVHQLVGGRDKQGRGGIEAAPFGEWGGKNADGADGFKDHRPGWEMPIHELLVRHHVAIVFHGHDHLFAKQDLDGIVYQEVPQLGFPGLGAPRSAAEYGYATGTILGGAGHLRVTVGAAEAKVEYVRAFLPKDENGELKNGQAGYAYEAPLIRR
jgi:predicted phosphodiesterase